MKNKSMQLKDTCEETGTPVMPVAINAWQTYPKISVTDTESKRASKSTQVNAAQLITDQTCYIQN